MTTGTKRRGQVISIIVILISVFYMGVDYFNGAGKGDFSYVSTAAVTIQQACLWIAAAVFAFVYFTKGGHKENASEYKVFAWIYLFNFYGILIAAILTTYKMDGTGSGLDIATVVYFTLMLIGFGALTLLTCAHDLGKKKARICLSLVLVANVAQFATIVLNNGVGNGSLMAFLARVLLVVMLYEMVSAKYQDKDARHTV